jgi:hypothetical protein
MYEVMKWGDAYSKELFSHVWDIPNFINSGQRLEKPQCMKEEMFELICDSWQQDPKERYTIDEIIRKLSFNTPEEIANVYVTKVALADTLEDYVTIAMLGGDDMEGQFIFVKASDYQTDQEALVQQRETDL